MRNKLLNNKKGFTLVELIIVIAIIAVLMAILIPTAGTLMTSARRTAATSRCSAIHQQLLMATTEGIALDAVVFTDVTVTYVNDAPATVANEQNFLVDHGNNAWEIRCYYGGTGKFVYITSETLQVKDNDKDPL